MRGITPRKGSILVYAIIAMVAMAGFCSLAVDFGRVQLVKLELRRAADAGARYGATGLADGTWQTKAIDAANDNIADGSVVTIATAQVRRGVWNSSTKTFTATSISPNAVEVTALRTAANNNAVSLSLAAIVGKRTVDVQATSVATYTASSTTVITAPSSGNPWLAGMPSGTTANGYDAAPANSPAQVTGMPIVPGATLNFSFTGSASYYPGTQPFDPDGNPGWIIENYAGSEHGKSNLSAPLTAVVGVFLDASTPSGTTPASLDFSTPASRDFSTLAPALRQPFFIGNGLRADGTTKQGFIVPTGATRLYLGIMDGQQWSDNAGSLTSTTVQPAKISVVK